MKIFINDKPLEIVKPEELSSENNFEYVFNRLEEIPSPKEFHDDVLIKEPSFDLVIKILYMMRTRKLKHLDSVTLMAKDADALIKFIKSRFTIVKAAGGVVSKGDKVLFIFRLEKWDLPKGKFEKGETPAECAIREVEEECNIQVKLGVEIGKTWHTYTHNRKSILKKTYWYAMESINDDQLKPQKEEGIDDIKWMNHQEAKVALINSYPSMRYLYKKYLKLTQKIK
jgi:8-oxo-(d)GTP phosphatase